MFFYPLLCWWGSSQIALSLGRLINSESGCSHRQPEMRRPMRSTTVPLNLKLRTLKAQYRPRLERECRFFKDGRDACQELATYADEVFCFSATELFTHAKEATAFDEALARVEEQTRRQVDLIWQLVTTHSLPEWWMALLDSHLRAHRQRFLLGFRRRQARPTMCDKCALNTWPRDKWRLIANQDGWGILGISSSTNRKRQSGGKFDPRRLRELRRQSGLSQQELADQVCVVNRTICRIEKGKQEPYPATFARLWQALGCQPQDLCEQKIQRVQNFSVSPFDKSFFICF